VSTIDPSPVDLTNEDRADLGAVAVGAVVDLLGDHGPAVAQIEDTLVYVAHLLDRYCLEPVETFEDALRRFKKDIGADVGARYLADGRHASIEAAS